MLYIQTPSPFFKGGEVSFDYLPRRGGSVNLKKRGESMAQGQVFLKGGADTFPI